jgi:16S rRNA (uracil1498-N3)-methyltransferase
LLEPRLFADFFADSSQTGPGWRRLLFWEDEKTTVLRDISFADAEGVVSLIGPAGGWTPEEAVMARARGFQSVRLAGHILRAETAGLTVAALCQFLLTNI